MPWMGLHPDLVAGRTLLRATCAASACAKDRRKRSCPKGRPRMCYAQGMSAACLAMCRICQCRCNGTRA